MTALDIRAIARALGGEVQGRQVLAPGPNHSRRDRSLSVRLSQVSPTGFVTFSHSGDPFDTCRDYVTQKLGMDLDAWRTRGRREARPTRIFTVPGARPSSDEARTARAVEIWREGHDPVGTLVDRYLASRGLVLPERGVEVLRYHPRCPWGDKALGRTIFVPAMLAAMRSVVDDRITAVHRTRLTDDGHKVDRMMLGPARGSAVKLDPDDVVTMGLAIGEGVETCLAARQLGIRPAWAMTSAGAMATLPILAGIESLTLFAERDETSARAVNACAARWHRGGREVIVVEPTSGSDLNDSLMARRVA